MSQRPEGDPPVWKDDFIKCLDSASERDVQFHKAILIKEENLPRHIYKYRRCTKCAFENLREGSVYMAPTTAYNDPFDSALTLSFSQLNRKAVVRNIDAAPYFAKVRDLLSKEDIEKVKQSDEPFETLATILLARDKNIPADKLPELVRALGDAAGHISRPMIEAGRKVVQQRTVLCSFSEVPDSIIMWGHYADSHGGFCVEYDLTRVSAAEEYVRRFLWPVIYSEKLFDATKYLEAAMEDFSAFNVSFPLIAALYKSPEWAYEKEWRLLFPGGVVGPGNRPMPPPSRVLLGAKISEDNKKTVAEICGRKGIPVHQMNLAVNAFKLGVRDDQPTLLGTNRAL